MLELFHASTTVSAAYREIARFFNNMGCSVCRELRHCNAPHSEFLLIADKYYRQ